MASSDVDQKYLGRLAQALEDANPELSDALYQLLGLSVVLSRKLYRARKLRRLDTTRDTRSLQLYHQIIWLSKSGLALLEYWVLPFTQDGQNGPEAQTLAAKLRASFLHVFCLFHNDPPVTVASSTTAVPSSSNDPESLSSSHDGTVKKTTPPKRNSRGSKQSSLRDPINSVTSDASFLTNPYADLPPGGTPPPHSSYPSSNPPPGLSSITVPHPSAFLIPSINFIPYADAYFKAASASASALLPGAHPLRLSVALEHAAFLWDCKHEHAGARHLARRAIRQLRDGEDEDVSDEAFEDAAEMVQILGRIMKRKSFDGTPRTGQSSSLTDTQVNSQSQQQSQSHTRSASESASGVVMTPTRVSLSQPFEYSGPPSAEGGPVGGITSTTPKRRESTKHHRRSHSSPQQASKYNRASGQSTTPPRPPPKDIGYTPSTKSSTRKRNSAPAVQPLNNTSSPTRRRRGDSSKNVGFSSTPNGISLTDGDYMEIDYNPETFQSTTPPSRGDYSAMDSYAAYSTTYSGSSRNRTNDQTNGNGTQTNGNGSHHPGHYQERETDRRGKGER